MRWKTIAFSIFIALGVLIGCGGAPSEPFVPLSVSISGPGHVGFYNPTEFQAVITGTNANAATVKWTTSDSDVSLAGANTRTVTWEPDTWIDGNYSLKLTVSHADEETITKQHEFTTSFCSSGAINDPAKPCGLQNLEQLRDVADHLDGHFVLLNDIDASDTIVDNFVPIGGDLEMKIEQLGSLPRMTASFTGTFDGGGYRITNLHVNWPEVFYVGLFGYIAEDAVVKNIHLVEAEIVGYSFVGGIAGANAGTILSSSITNSIVRFDQNIKACGVDNNGWLQGEQIGGLAGRFSQDTSITRESYALKTSVFGCNYVGGLAGGIHGVVTDSYALGGTVEIGFDAASHVGGFTSYIIGTVDNPALVERSFALMSSAVGHSYEVSVDRLKESFWSSEYPGAPILSANGTNLTAVEFGDQSTFSWDFDDVWQMGPPIPGFDALALPDLRNNPR